MNSRYGAGIATLGGVLLLAAGIACGSDPDSASPGATAPLDAQSTATPVTVQNERAAEEPGRVDAAVEKILSELE